MCRMIELFFFVSPHCDKCLGLSSCLLLAEICPRPSGSAWLQALLHLGGVVVRRASHGRRGAGELCRLRLRPSVTHRPAGMRVCHRWEWPFFFFFPPSLIHYQCSEAERKVTSSGNNGTTRTYNIEFVRCQFFIFMLSSYVTQTLSWGMIITWRADVSEFANYLKKKKEALRVAESATGSGCCRCGQMALPVLVPVLI